MYKIFRLVNYLTTFYQHNQKCRKLRKPICEQDFHTIKLFAISIVE